MTIARAGAPARAGIRRDGATWFSYLLLGCFTYLNTSQGNTVPFLREELSLSYAVVSLHASAIAVGILLVGFIADRVVTRLGRRRTLLAGGLASAAAAVALAFAPSAVVSIGSCFFIGAFGGFVPAVVSALLSDIHGDRRNVALAEGSALCYLFALTAPLLLAFALAMGWSWRLVPLAGGLATAIVVVAFWRASIPDGVAPPRSLERPQPLPPSYWAYWALLGFGVALEFSCLLWAPSYLERVVGLSPSAAALGGSAFLVAMLIGRTAGIGLVKRFAPRTIFFGMAAFISAGFLIYWAAPMPPLAIFGLFVIGLGIAPFFPLGITVAMSTVPPAASDRASSRSVLAPAIGIILNPPLLGAIADAAGLWFAQLMIPVLLCFALAAFLFGQRLEARGA